MKRRFIVTYSTAATRAAGCAPHSQMLECEGWDEAARLCFNYCGEGVEVIAIERLPPSALGGSA